MQIVIDVPEHIYEHIKDVYEHSHTVEATYSYIYNGTPLPKGHGRLIDADAFQKYCFNKYFDKRLSDEGLATINMFLDLQPTIIEADSEVTHERRE